MISIVTITFNNFSELEATLKSLEAATSSEEIQSVVINGGSCQKTISFLNSFSGKSLTEVDNGISDGFNKGIREADGEYIGFINSGDFLIDPNYFSRVLDILEKDPSLDYIYCSILFEHQKYGELEVGPNIGQTAKMPFPHPGLIVRKSIFQEIGGFDLQLKVAMDFDFVHRLLLGNYKSYFYKENPVVRMIGDGVSSQDGTSGIKERRLVLKRLGLLKADEEKYLNTLYAKTIVRLMLSKFGLINFYDAIKMRIKKPQAE